MLNLLSVVMEKKNLCVKQSDFSIDHILNRAGENVRRRHEIQEVSFIDQWQGCSSQYHPEKSVDLHSHTPHLNWLQYTRYHPPKLPRPLRLGPVKRTPGRLPRVPFTVEQLAALEEAYRVSTYLSSEDANNLAQKLNLSCVRVKIWFQNRRARERRERRNCDSGTSPPCENKELN
ncbi:homeobox protein MSH-D-like [Phlebotomus papatasi]|uniref:homeobox protein MSH-D-like n=1 Tax=Phlebotomus papatasi TaxID=29031 RepID=UPI0024833CFA|nr:homeobox protein MSH-D-like [Phlebotomus papatasi]